MHDSNTGFGFTDKVPPITLVVIEEQEIYRKLYGAICSAESPVQLLECLPCEEKQSVALFMSRTPSDVILVGVNHVTTELLVELTQVQDNTPGQSIVLIASYLTSGIIPAFNKFVASRKAHFGFLFRKTLNHTDQFVSLLSSVKAGNTVIDPAFGTPMVKDTDNGMPMAELTPREIAVLNLIARGCTNEAISVALCIDVKTVRHHINNIYGKLKTNSAFDDRHPRVSATNAYHQLTGQLVFEDLD